MSVDPKKVKAICSITPPQNISELRSLMGLLNYCSEVIPDFATITKLLRELTRKSAKWQWTDRQQSTFDVIKGILASNPVLAFFDPSKSSELIVDASRYGLSGILIHSDENLNPKVISYASRSLSNVERRYPQTEHEALAIVWECERFHLYLYGAPFVIQSDHRPLQYLFNNPLSKPPARIERWQLLLAPYDFTVRYRPGKDNPADYRSRHSLDNQSVRSSNAAEEYVNFIAEHAVPVALSLQEIEESFLNDKVLQEVIKCMASDNWQNAKVSLELKDF